MVNPNGDVAKRRTQLSTQTVEGAGPPRIMGNYLNSLRQQGPSDMLGGRKLVSSRLDLSGVVQPHRPRVSPFLVSIVYCESLAGGSNSQGSLDGWDDTAHPALVRA